MIQNQFSEAEAEKAYSQIREAVDEIEQKPAVPQRHYLLLGILGGGVLIFISAILVSGYVPFFGKILPGL